MTNKFTRRHLLGFVPVVVSSFAGCVPPPESGSHAHLLLDLRNVTNTDGQYRLELNPRVSVTGNWEPFRNVSVVAKNEDAEVFCRHSIGDLTEGGRHEPLTVTCDGFPHTITYEIERDPCGPNTSVQKYVYDPEQELWVGMDIECD